MAPTTISGFSAGANPMNQPCAGPCGFWAVAVLPAIATLPPNRPAPRAVPRSTTLIIAWRKPASWSRPSVAREHLVEPDHVDEGLGILPLPDGSVELQRRGPTARAVDAVVIVGAT